MIVRYTEDGQLIVSGSIHHDQLAELQRKAKKAEVKAEVKVEAPVETPEPKPAPVKASPKTAGA